jgi:GNAT superfamily N-acetyltransferase
MATSKEILQSKFWTKDQFLVSTDPSLIPIPDLIDAFNSKEVYWANASSPEAMKEMVENSLNFSVYDQQTPPSNGSANGSQGPGKFIGLARLITDYITFAYLTDVWIHPEYQGKGLGGWMIRCLEETLEPLPYLRRTMLLTADWERSVPFYNKLLKATLMDGKDGNGLAVMEVKGRGHPAYGREGTGYESVQNGT